MMELGQRSAMILGEGGDDGWGIYYRARDLIRAGERVVNLTIGEPDVKTDPAIFDAMRAAAAAGHSGYTVGPGLEPLRRAIAARVERMTGVPTAMENVIVTPGGQAALFAAHMVTLDPGQAGLYCAPFYPTYPGTIRATGARAIEVPTRSSEDFQPRAAAILQAAAEAQGARTLLINTPNNPTGVLYTPETMAAVAGAVREAGLWLISDEVYDGQVWSGRHLSARALPGMAERTLVIGSFSKSFAMTGSRIGWMVGPAAAIEAAGVLATATTYGIPPFIQMGALHALSLGEGFEAAVADPFRRRRDIAARVLGNAAAVRLIPAEGAMYVMLDIRATGLSGAEFAARLLEAERIAVMPGESFGAPSAGHVRVALTVADEDLAGALERLAGFAAGLAR
ncbi:pyridoxal phosphate-dependent aminotransferase [Frigidibacter sp. MR17.14]|uniref:pyridoxal phosphate-dependent aminotransferase n=1 Tax=Frigidibacter sp. MR17.14 TaxID=3126509 RepID=UPI003012C01E